MKGWPQQELRSPHKFTTLGPSLQIILIVAAILFCAPQTQAEGTNAPGPDPIKILFFVPSDLTVPEGVRQRITKIADATEAFLFQGMTRHGYPPVAKALFRRDAGGLVELLHVRGEDTASSGKYAQPTCTGYVIKKAIEQHHLPEGKYVWWIFFYLGDRPTRFENWAGAGDPRDGGWAAINYDTVPGEIRPDLQLTEGFNFEYKLKSTVHELAHGFGLPHMGPDPTLDLGNSLMGPNPPMYAARHFPKGDHVYLAASEAAMLWKHPIFCGKALVRFEAPEVKLVDYKAVFQSDTDTVTVSGKLISNQSAHSVVLIDNRGDQNEYWSRSYADRIASDGTFRIKVNHPARINGQYRIAFCFESGAVTGDGSHFGSTNLGEIRKSYGFQDGQFQFQE